MDRATASLLHLWDATDGAVGALHDEHWDRPLTPGTRTVSDLVAHLAGAQYADRARLRSAVGVARRRAARAAHRGSPTGDALAHRCLHLCLHAHDLHAVVDRDLDPEIAEDAAVAACELALASVPRLLAQAGGAQRSSVRVVVRPGARARPALDRTVRIVDGHAAAWDDAACADVIDADALSLLLLLTHRRGADELADAGLLSWTGRTGAALVATGRG